MASKSPGGLHKAGLAVRLVGASVLAGGLVAAAFTPLVGVLGLSAKSAAEDFNKLPDELAAPVLAQASTVYDASGGVIAAAYSRDRTVVPLSQIAPIMRNAIVDIEDHRFYQHGAIDLQGTLRALTSNAGSGGVSQGGSTLTQQYVKNVFVEAAGDDQAKVLEAQRQTTGRKIKELRYAIKLEENLTKDQILADYLNITFFGEQAYGVEAAAERYFSVHAAQLTVPQAALLAGLVQSPSAYDPIASPGLALQRRNQVLGAMAAYGTITRAQATTYQATNLGLKASAPQEGCITAVQGEAFFCDYVEHEILQDPEFGPTVAAREQLWSRGGLQIHTTLDPKSQQAANASVTSHAYPGDRPATAITMIQPGTGRVLAMAQSRPYGNGPDQTDLNYNTDRLTGGGSGFPTGSTFKAVTAAAALEQGIPMSYTVNAPYQADYPQMTDCTGAVHPQTPGDQNDSPDLQGKFNMKTAMAMSVNTYFVPLEAKAGLCNVVHMAQRLGLGYQATLDPAHPGQLYPLEQVQSLTLGVNSYTPMQIAAVYAAFAADGRYCKPMPITSVSDNTGHVLSVPTQQCNQAMSPTTAKSVNTLLASVVADGGTASSIGSIGWQDAGKTGTTNNSLQVWFTGYTRQIAASTVVSDTTAPLASLDGAKLGPSYFPVAFGYSMAGPIWAQAMTGAMSGQPQAGLDETPFIDPSASPSPSASPASGSTTSFAKHGGRFGHGHPHRPRPRPPV
ncbi:transglycosylase domain-containing protein [Streptacidiphilus sp. P02-A3a]|uniref:transglycosylase domain-containing protein n=1 Tax=Streptacidiphilus sp. P02-A3a TaxID=2704468 RepID=UPI0015F7991C|nr:transglycosylase domain-containing protein [Streptacidiphilus sp. P02-A3a]QMU69721.1 penicillin-binding protein [Streptacidiphilus sp. P02-A3a]